MQPEPEEKLRDRLAAESYEGRMTDGGGDGGGGGGGSACGMSCLSFGLLLLLVLALAGVAALTSLVVISGRQNAAKCGTGTCVLQAASMLRTMNLSAAPCQDFHNYACGNWDHANPPQPGIGKYSNFHKATRDNFLRLYGLLSRGESSPRLRIRGRRSLAAEKAAAYFAGCSNTTAREALGPASARALVRRLGGWSLTPDLSDTRPPDGDTGDARVLERVALANELLAQPFFLVQPSASQFNHRRRAISVNQGFAPYQRSALLSVSDKFRLAYLAYAEQVLKAAGSVVSDAARRRLEELWGLEVQLERLRNSYVERRRIAPRIAEPGLFELTLRDLCQRLSRRLLPRNPDATAEALTAEAVRLSPKFLGVRIHPSTLIRVENLDYLLGLAELFLPRVTATAPVSTLLSDYVVMTTMRSFVHALSDQFQEARRQEKQKIYGNNVLDNLWLYCTGKTDLAFKFVTGALVLQRTVTDRMLARVTVVVDNIKRELRQAIAEAPWMDAVTRARALTKVDRIKQVVGYPRIVLDAAKLDSFYADLTVDTSDYFGSYMRVRAAKRRWSIDHLSRRRPHHAFEWGHSPLTANAFFSQASLRMTIVAGILQPPFFDADFQDAFLYGALGSIIGHELNHAFDARGRFYNSAGSLQQWWTGHTEAEYRKRQGCYVDQYSAYKAYGVHNRAAHTVEENMADNGGALVAYRAFRRSLDAAGNAGSVLPGLGFQPDQVFFLAFGQLWCGHVTRRFGRKLMETDVHSVYQHRVRGTLSNMPQFAQAFKCPAGSAYSPKERCSLWT